ncbi:PhoX family phosphatase [Rhizobacter sp. Root404]|uniref:PhoX family protein n=1 Tax=Rhizobacter sp. Root404 TaxID=1736528 RepID=UPI0006FC922A|nr:PhoX family phosphatase [Rhizobacter sp. Root404]KQW35252.1 Tat pathway signal protein [Rhizobacter sp. Root404]
MAKDFDTMEDSNRASNPSIHDVSDPARRVWLQGGLAAFAGAAFGPLMTGCATAGARTGAPLLGFKGIPASAADRITVPDGYVATVIAAWGEPIGVPGQMPAWREDASASAADQAVQMGMHHDGIHFFPLAGSSTRGLLTMNHEYTDDGLLHADGMATWSAEKVRKAQAAHGIAVIEVERRGDAWTMVRPSPYARRITATTPFAIGGPAGGHALMKTAADPAGRTALGTFNNCASGKTPWGTYLSGEENFNGYFALGDAKPDAHQQRWGLRKTAFYRWNEHDERFDAAKHPNEFNRFGWIVEVDPMDPKSTPVKRTALGRAVHEGAWVAVTRDGRAVVYSGEDSRFEYIYKFVSRDRIAPAGNGLTQAQANRELLDHGTLYVARFDADGTGRWMPLVHGTGPLTGAKGFADQGEVLIKARQASDLLGATKMDRPEWLAIDQQAREVYCTLTNNTARGAKGQPGVDAANPRADNAMGQIIRWKEGAAAGGDFDATTMRWDHLVLAGDPANERADAKGNIKGDIFGSPDGLMLDARGVLWVQTDASATQLNKGEYARIGNNQMLAFDRGTGEVRRFLTGPVNCEITGATLTPDGTTMFINVQHPGETPSDRSDPAEPNKFSKWPSGGRPRSATVVIRRLDGGVIGA